MSKINLDKLPFYVINLEKSTDRWKKVEASFKKEKMDKNLIKFLACDGSLPDVDKMRKKGDVKIPVKDEQIDLVLLLMTILWVYLKML